MLRPDQTVYVTFGPFVREARFLSWRDGACLVAGLDHEPVVIDRSRVYGYREEAETRKVSGLSEDYFSWRPAY